MTEIFNKNISSLIENKQLEFADSCKTESLEENIQNDSCYAKEAVLSKNGISIPVFTTKKTMYSVYNPVNDGERFAKNADADFFIIAGLGNGCHISSILKNNPECRIIVIEKNIAAYKTLFNLFDFSKIISSNVIFSTIDTLERDIFFYYKPALYHDFSFIPHAIWLQHNQQACTDAKNIIEKTLKAVSRDFSVQSHFGKIWMRNIIRNLYSASKLKEKEIILPVNRKIAIIAAGASLNKQINLLKKNADDFYILSTDTAFQTLQQNDIEPDAIISIDGQNISYEHFITSINKKTTVILDLCSHPLIAEKAMKKGCDIIFTASSHPFCQLVQKWSCENSHDNAFMNIDASSGTVTIAAIDFARKCGFSDIALFGADFSYLNDEAYAKGTYLEKKFIKTLDRLNTLDTLYSKLMFRTELSTYSTNPLDKTSETLKSYAGELEKYIDKYQSNSKKGNINRYADEGYPVNNFGKITIENKTILQIKPFNADKFFNWYKESIYSSDILKEDSDIVMSVLPFMAWFSKNQNSKSTKEIFHDAVTALQKKITKPGELK